MPGADSVAEGPQSEGREDAAALPAGNDGREGPLWHPRWRVALKRRAGARGSLGWDGMGGKEHNEEDDDKNSHADEDNHLHVLPPELPGHLLRCGLEVLRLLGTRQSEPVPPPTEQEDKQRPTCYPSKYLSEQLREQTVTQKNCADLLP